MPWGVAAAAAASIAGAGISASASSDAASKQVGAANAATNLQRGEFEQTSANLQPFLNTGVGANTTLAQLMGIGTTQPAGANPAWANSTSVAGPTDVAQMYQTLLGRPMEGDPSAQTWVGQPISQVYKGILGSAEYAGRGGAQPTTTFDPNAPLVKPFSAADFHSSPGYNFQLGQGVNAIDNSSAAKGFSGNTLKDLMTFGQGLANQDWWNAYNAYTQNQNNIFNRFSTLSGSGQNAAVQQGGFANSYGANAGNNITGAGNAGAAGIIGGANAAGGALNSIGQNYLLYTLLNKNQNSGYNFLPDLISAGGMAGATSGGVGAAPY